MPRSSIDLSRGAKRRPTADEAAPFVEAAAVKDADAPSGPAYTSVGQTRANAGQPARRAGRRPGRPVVMKTTLRVRDPADQAVLEAVRRIQAIRGAVHDGGDEYARTDVAGALAFYAEAAIRAEGDPTFVAILDQELAKVARA